MPVACLEGVRDDVRADVGGGLVDAVAEDGHGGVVWGEGHGGGLGGEV